VTAYGRLSLRANQRIQARRAFLQRQKAQAALGKIHSWQPQNILLSHGRCFDAHADEVIRRIFGEPHCE
jgi:hypothetical protein